MTAYKVTPSTSLYSFSDEFDSDSPAADSLTVDAGAFVISNAAVAVRLANTGSWTVTINGTVYSQLNAGIYLAPGNSGISKFTIGEEAYVGSVDDIGLRLLSSATVVNKGIITGVDPIVLAGAMNSITNFGRIG